MNNYEKSAGFEEHCKTVQALMNKEGWRYERWLNLCLCSLPHQERFYKSELERLEKEKIKKENLNE